jgi:hypothetical protein
MADTAARSLMIVFCLGGIMYAWFAFIIKKENRNKGKTAFHGLFALTLILQGAAFLSYYPYNRFEFLANMIFVFFPYAGIILGYYFNKEKQKTVITRTIAGILVFLTIWKLAAFTELTFTARMPFNLCNIIVIHLAVRCFFKSRVLDNYIMCFGFIAAGINYFIGAFYDDTASISSLGQGFFYYRMLESALLHNLISAYCSYSFITESIIVNRKSAMLNMCWIIPLFVIFSFCNQIWKTDFFFTGVYGVTPQFLIDIYYAFPLRFQVTINHVSFDVHILYSLFLIGAAGAALWIVSAVLGGLQEKLRGRLESRNFYSEVSPGKPQLEPAAPLSVTRR